MKLSFDRSGFANDRRGFLPLIGIIILLAVVAAVIVVAIFWPNILIGLILICAGLFLVFRPIIPNQAINYGLAIACIAIACILILWPGWLGLQVV